ncbi:ubiquitin-conjugating enzyme 3 [Striga asiatica]|uniref:Ubiquitin-conjugating enzyme 3 n=1 Tax=Striga asiatica TaxID=4170 RepID=A0A5A7QLD3_STRAF|nr:ubiquitin-conjugating enzyme 3 [Striga asiatica]
MNGDDKIAASDDCAVLVELPLGDAAPDFSLEKAVCSHGLFMMSPNHWDPHSKTFRRPLRLDADGDETSRVVHVSHPPDSAHVLHVRVIGTRVLTTQQQQFLLPLNFQSQVRRMLRLSEEENRRIVEFHELHQEAKQRGFGRMFRSPTLFEDVIKCILLCNCQWSRTLGMAQALCELQAELQHPSNEVHIFAPNTPAGKESKRNSVARKCSKKLGKKYTEDIAAVEDIETNINNSEILNFSDETEKLSTTLISTHVPMSQPSEGTKDHLGPTIGNFPSPKELATLDEGFLARRCGLGYRARRVINFAREIVQGRFQLSDLECVSCGTVSISNYENLSEKLRVMEGFGPYTCANVLMCVGYYHVVPSDSETIRHLKQVHAKRSTIETVQSDVEDIYGKYAPFQFLAFWSEIWQFYEERFGNLSQLSPTDYKLITAANMRPKKRMGSKRKLSVVDEV